jgi:hypothetical protein
MHSSRKRKNTGKKKEVQVETLVRGGETPAKTKSQFGCDTSHGKVVTERQNKRLF